MATPRIYRIDSIPINSSPADILAFFSSTDHANITILSLAPHPSTTTLVATIAFTPSKANSAFPSYLHSPPILLNPTSTPVSLDDDFEGLTPLYDTDGAAAGAEVVAVADLFEHPYHTSERAWLSGVLPKDIPDARIMLYGHDVELHSEKGLLEACAERCLSRLEGAFPVVDVVGEDGRKGGKPIVLVGVRTGCLVIEKALVMAQTRRPSQLSSRLAGLVFFDAPHGGLSEQFLEPLLPQGKSQSVIVDELRRDSRVLQQLDAEFAHVVGSTPVISCLSMSAIDGATSSSSNWIPSKVIIHQGCRDALAQKYKARKESGKGQYHRVGQEIKKCLGRADAAEAVATLQQQRQHLRCRSENYINFSLPVRSAAQMPAESHTLKRKDSLSPLASPSWDQTFDGGVDSTTLRRTSDSALTPSILQKIAQAAANKSARPESSSSSSTATSTSSSSASSVSSVSSVHSSFSAGSKSTSQDSSSPALPNPTLYTLGDGFPISSQSATSTPMSFIGPNLTSQQVRGVPGSACALSSSLSSSDMLLHPTLRTNRYSSSIPHEQIQYANATQPYHVNHKARITASTRASPPSSFPKQNRSFLSRLKRSGAVAVTVGGAPYVDP